MLLLVSHRIDRGLQQLLVHQRIGATKIERLPTGSQNGVAKHLVEAQDILVHHLPFPIQKAWRLSLKWLGEKPAVVKEHALFLIRSESPTMAQRSAQEGLRRIAATLWKHSADESMQF